MPDEILRIQNLTKKKHNYPVLKHFSLDLFAGEILTIVGPDNSAKEMLAQILSGTQKPDLGRLFLMGTENSFLLRKKQQGRTRFFSSTECLTSSTGLTLLKIFISPPEASEDSSGTENRQSPLRVYCLKNFQSPSPLKDLFSPSLSLNGIYWVYSLLSSAALQ